MRPRARWPVRAGVSEERVLPANVGRGSRGAPHAVRDARFGPENRKTGGEASPTVARYLLRARYSRSNFLARSWAGTPRAVGSAIRSEPGCGRRGMFARAIVVIDARHEIHEAPVRALYMRMMLRASRPHMVDLLWWVAEAASGPRGTQGPRGVRVDSGNWGTRTRCHEPRRLTLPCSGNEATARIAE
jgi:hypothetical protein